MTKLHFNLADLYECVADHVPDREAVVYGDRRLTFGEVDERATRLAHHLQAAGIGPGDRVGLYLYNCNEYIEAALAAFKLRAVPVNINFRYVEEELRYLFDDAGIAALVFHREFAPRVDAVAGSLPSLKTFVHVEDGSAAASPSDSIEYEAALAAASPKRDFAERSGTDLYLIYTGGTTGMPKGVMWRHEDVFFAGLQGGNPGGADITSPEEIGPNAFERKVAPTTLPVAPLMHGNGYWAALIGLHGGGKVVLATKHRLDPHELWSLVERERVQVMSIVGDAMARPLADALHEAGAAYDTSSLVVISSGGAIWSETVKQQLREKLGTTLLIDAFGVSEAGHQGMNLGPNETGRPRFTVDPFTAVLDDDLRPIAPGSDTVGRLARCGRLPLGYWNDEEKTARTFVTDADGRRWVIPGDMATIEADGTVTLLGRGSLCINSGGEKIYPEEVESALKSHPAVFDAVVVGVPDERWGERVAAVVQPRTGATPSLEDIVAHCRTKVSGYKVPREMHLVEEIQRSPAGKADYRWAKAVAVGNGGD
ncbi:MAG: acyl-CoA synthetase [Chloroflexota bacterium]|nr:acyl-CoA synthetase [Chloroflexota bacterium]